MGDVYDSILDSDDDNCRDIGTDTPISSITDDDLDYTVSNKTYRVEFDRPIDIVTHALHTPNCIHSTGWRCTQHFVDFSVNIFKQNVWMLMTRELDADRVMDMVESKFGVRPRKVTVVNITVMVRLPVTLNLESLHDNLSGGVSMQDILNGTKRSNEDFYFMDKQKFPALIAKPNKNDVTVMELYTTGAMNITGMKKNEQIADAIAYIKDRIVPNIRVPLG